MERLRFTLKLLYILSITQVCSSTITESEFSRQPLCSVQTFIENGCMRITPARGKVDCARLCSQDSQCQGVSLDSNDACFTHQQCGIDDPALCTDNNDDDNYKLYLKAASPTTTTPTTVATIITTTTTAVTVLDCYNGGNWDYVLNRCNCVDVWCGRQCDRRPLNCYDLYYHGYDTMAYMFVNLNLPNSVNVVPVLCHYEEGDAYVKTMIMSNYYRGVVQFNRTWADYVNGFTSYPNQMFIGLEKLYELNNNGYTSFKLYIQAHDGEYEFVYKNFHLTPESNNFQYTLELDSFTTLSGVERVVGDCFINNQNTPFSTSDQMNVAGDNCAEQGMSGWWFTSGCGDPCLPLGLNTQQLPLPQQPEHFYIDGLLTSNLKKISVYFHSDIATLLASDLY